MPVDSIPSAAVPVAARPAASLILVRGGANTAEVLMGLRGARHRFMPNRLVFPGGTVDAGDFDAVAATPPDPAVLQRLRTGADPRLAHALMMAAARELEEETGLSLGDPPHLDGVDYLCRAITPTDYPMRFDARFLTLDADHVGGRLGGSGELEGLRWYGLAEALALDLAEVTAEVLGVLRDWLALPPASRQARARAPVFRECIWGWE